MYKAGVWNVVCAQCGFDKKSDEVRQRWDGPYVCKDTCWEPRHVLDFFTSPPPEKQIPWSQKVNEDYSVTNDTDGSVSVLASLTDTIYTFSGDAGLKQVSLPAANSTEFVRARIVYQLQNNSNVSYTIVALADNGLIGNAEILADTTAFVQNDPIGNYWIRVG